MLDDSALSKGQKFCVLCDSRAKVQSTVLALRLCFNCEIKVATKHNVNWEHVGLDGLPMTLWQIFKDGVFLACTQNNATNFI